MSGKPMTPAFNSRNLLTMTSMLPNKNHALYATLLLAKGLRENGNVIENPVFFDTIKVGNEDQ